MIKDLIKEIKQQTKVAELNKCAVVQLDIVDAKNAIKVLEQAKNIDETKLNVL